MSYKHLSIVEREKIAINRAEGKSIHQIAKLLGRNKSTIWRELARNPGDYLPSKAQARYRRRRKKCHPHKLLELQNNLSSNLCGKIPISNELAERPIAALRGRALETAWQYYKRIGC